MLTGEAQRILRALLDISYRRTGLEGSSVVTGTAGVADHLSKWNAAGDLVDAGNAAAVMTLLGFPANSQSLVTAADYAAMRTLLGLVIGTNVQAFDADLTSWAAITRAAGFDTFATTPSSANFAALLTDESGTAGTVPFHQTGTWTPTVTAVTGTLTSVTGQAGNYIKIGSLVLAWYVFVTANVGTGGTGLLVTTPFTVSPTRAGGAYRNGGTGTMGSVTLNTSTTILQQQYNGVFGAANGDTFVGFMAFSA
jgi:hypothetical protein